MPDVFRGCTHIGAIGVGDRRRGLLGALAGCSLSPGGGDLPVDNGLFALRTRQSPPDLVATSFDGLPGPGEPGLGVVEELERASHDVRRCLSDDVDKFVQFDPPSVQISFPLVLGGFAPVSTVFALVGDLVTLVGDPVTLVRDSVTLVGDPVTLVGERPARVTCTREYFDVFAGSEPMRRGPLLDRGPASRFVA